MPPKQAQSSRARSIQASSSGTPGSISLERTAVDDDEVRGTARATRTTADVVTDLPPPWRAPLSKTADLGYPDFLPARPGYSQPEDRITEQNVKQGFQGGSSVAVQTEGFSVHGPIAAKLKSAASNTMESLSKLADEIMAVKAKSVPVIPKWAYKLPNRVVYNETMRQAFIADLVNPSFPLQRLAKSIPHGYKGHDLLEMLYSRNVPFDRAAWLVQALGAHEVVAIRNRASSSTSLIPPAEQYSIEFTTVYCAFLRKQLVEITLPQRPAVPSAVKANDGKATRPGQTAAPSRPPAPAKNLLGDPLTRERWLAKWEHSLELIKWLMAKRLVHERTWTGWLADQISSSHMGQLGFMVAQLVQYMDMAFKSKATARAAVRACVDQLGQICAHRHRVTLAKVENMLRVLIRNAFLRCPEIFICPTSWLWHEELLHELLSGPDQPMSAAFESIRRRNNAMLLRDVPLPPGGSTSNRRAMAAIQVLDSMNASSKLQDVYEAYFVQGSDAAAKGGIDIISKIQMLLNWSTGFAHLGPHRPYLCSALLTIVKQDPRWSALHSKSPEWLELVIFEWLDDTATSMAEVKFNSVGITIGDLTRMGLFSLGDYLRRQVARGITDSKRLDSPDSKRLRSLLKHLPAFATAPALLNLRNRVLAGMGMSVEEQAAGVQLMKDELTFYLANWRDLVPVPMEDVPAVSHELPCTKAASRHVQVQIRMWILPIALRTVGRLTDLGDEGVDIFARIINSYEAGRGIASIHQVILRAIPTAGFAMLDSIIYTVMRHLDVWAAMDCLDSLSAAVFERYFSLAEDGYQPKHQSPVCWELAHKAHLTHKHAQIIRDWLIQDLSPPAANDPVPRTLSSVQAIHRESDLLKVENIARDLSERFDQDPQFPATVWRCAIESLTAAQQLEGQEARSLTAIAKLLTIIGDLHDLKPSGGLRGAFADWADRLSKDSFVELYTGAPRMLANFLLLMVDNRILMGKAIFHHLVFPIWLQLSRSRNVLAGTPTAKEINLLQMCSTFAHGICLSRGDSVSQYGPTGLLASQCFAAHVAAIFADSPAMEEFIQHLALLPLLELSFSEQADAASKEVTVLREGISCLATFKKAAYRHLDVLKEAFLTRRARVQHEKRFDTRLVEALLLIMTDNDDASESGAADIAYDWTDERAELSPWQWKRTVLELRLSLKRLSMHVEEPDSEDSAVSTDDFAATLLDRPLTNDQVALIEEAMKGIDPGAANVILKAGIDRLSSHLQNMVSSEDNLQLDMLDQVRTVSRVLAITLQQSRAAGYQRRASAAGISDPARYVQSLAALVKRLTDETTADRNDILHISTLTLRLYLSMVGGTADIATLSAPVIASLLQSAFDLAEVNQDDSAQLFYKDLFSFVIDELPREKRFVAYDKLLALGKSVPEESPREGLPDEVLEVLPSADNRAESTPSGVPLSCWEALPFVNQDQPDTTSNLAFANGGSVDFLAFKATLTGDRLQATSDLDCLPSKDEFEFEARPWEIWASERGLQGHSALEWPFARDFATGLLQQPPIDHRMSMKQQVRKGQSPSPASARPSLAVSSNEGKTIASAIEIADDEEPVSKGKSNLKRAASPESVDKGLSASTRRPSASQAKRPKIAQKAVARKSTGGKTVSTASKSVGSSAGNKTLRKSSISNAGAGAAVKVGRRKSGAGL